MVGEIYRATGVHQYAFVYLIIMTLAPAIFLLTVDLERVGNTRAHTCTHTHTQSRTHNAECSAIGCHDTAGNMLQ